MIEAGERHPVTPDGRYFVVRGRLWRCSDLALPPDRRAELMRDLMDARRRVGAALKAGDAEAERTRGRTWIGPR